MIEVSNLVKRYGRTEALSGVSCRIERGEVVGLLGPNGAGKSTMLRILSTVLVPSAGNILIAGHDTERESLQVRRRLGYLPERPPLYPELRVREQLAYHGRLRGFRGSRLREAIDRAAAACDLNPVLRKLCGQLSKGYQQRVGLAQAILHDPEVLILDEPTCGLDPVQIQGIRRLISSLAEQRTVILSTHLFPEVRSMCSRALVLSGGRIVADENLSRFDGAEELEQLFLESVGYQRETPPSMAIPLTGSW